MNNNGIDEKENIAVPELSIRRITCLDGASYGIGDTGFAIDGKVTKIESQVNEHKSNILIECIVFVVYVDGKPYIHLPYHAIQRYMVR